jgi:FkbM family methyltransferase
MVSSLFRAVLHRSGFVVHFLGDAGWHVARRGGRRTSTRRLRDGAWLVELGQPRRVRRLGPAQLDAHLLYDRRAARRHMRHFQKALGDVLAEEQIAWVLRKLGINCVLDVGANRGQYARNIRQNGYTGRIVSFEPLPHLAAPLRTAAEDDPDWLVHECALGEENTTAEINVVRGSTMSSLLTPSDFGRDWTSKLCQQGTENIRLRRLDSILDEAVAGIDQPRVYLKMDTQGYDLQTFRGAGDRIEEILAMQSEVSCLPIYDDMPRLPEQLAEYESAEFELAGMFPVSRHVKTLRVIEFDCVMVRADAFGDGTRSA